MAYESTELIETVTEIIRTRRSIGKVQPERPPKEMIERLLAAACWAPNHGRQEPWFFHIFAGDARAELGKIAADAYAALYPDREAKIAKLRGAPLRAPVVVSVTVPPSDDPIVHRENYGAACAAIQNMALLATAEGLGLMWRTGDMAELAAVKELLGLPPHGIIAGFIYIGYPAIEPPSAARCSIDQRSAWHGWEEE